MNKNSRKEGEYPFYPVKPEHMVLKPVTFTTITDEETHQERKVIDYGAGIDNTSKRLQWGE